MHPYNSKFEKMIYTTRTFNELIEGTTITFKSLKNADLFLVKTEDILTKYIIRTYVKFQKNTDFNTTTEGKDKAGGIDSLIKQKLFIYGLKNH